MILRLGGRLQYNLKKKIEMLQSREINPAKISAVFYGNSRFSSQHVNKASYGSDPCYTQKLAPGTTQSQLNNRAVSEKFKIPGLDSTITLADLESNISLARNALIAQQNPDGHWRYDIECHIYPSTYYIVCLHYIGEELSTELKIKLGRYIRRHQLAGGGWGFVPGGEMYLSNSVMSYWALKLIGDSPDAEHMKRARMAILAEGGVEQCDVMSRFHLALCGIVPWTCLPTIPVEIMFLPRWFPFHIFKIAYWARVAMVPMTVLQALRRGPRSASPIELDEIFQDKPSAMKPLPRAPHQHKSWFLLFKNLDRLLKAFEKYIPNRIRKKAMSAAESYCVQRLNGLDGFGSVLPSMLSVLMMIDALNYATNHPARVAARQAVERLVVNSDIEAYTTACLSPVWDSGQAISALLEDVGVENYPVIEKGLAWLRPLQILDIKEDWAFSRPNLRPGGWAFFYNNPYFPDLDDTAVVLSTMQLTARFSGTSIDKERIERGTEWLIGMQTKEGGWASFEPDNSNKFLNNIPLADHTALLDPPTVDVTSRCVRFLALAGQSSSEPARRGLRFILEQQEADGSWYGRWGVNYIYGTWSALEALSAAGLTLDQPNVTKAVDWLLSIQNSDGGWGEDVVSYNPDYNGHVPVSSTASQTAWALLGLMSVGVLDHAAVDSGVAYLIRKQNAQGQWGEAAFTGTGHPRILYLKYHGYPKYFPLQALARYVKLKKQQQTN